jgi:hypothetical protein
MASLAGLSLYSSYFQKLMDGRWGVVSFADSLDCVGVFGKSVDTVKTVFGEHDSNEREHLS